MSQHICPKCHCQSEVTLKIDHSHYVDIDMFYASEHGLTKKDVAEVKRNSQKYFGCPVCDYQDFFNESK